MSRRILLLTSAALPALAPDDRLLATAFRDGGWEAEPVVWSAGPSRMTADVAMVRSCWDYTDDPAGFLAALCEISGRMPLWNPLETIRWNLDKRYLLKLASLGVAVPPTRVVSPNQVPSLEEMLAQLHAEELVVKPVVGAGGADTFRIARSDGGRWAQVMGGRAMLVQPFLPDVLTAGEVSLVFLDGAYSHAVVKRAAPGEFRVQEEHGGQTVPWQPPESVVGSGRAALDAVDLPWCYARVDGIVTPDGFLLMEIELIEPDLFFAARPAAARDFVASLSRALAMRSR